MTDITKEARAKWVGIHQGRVEAKLIAWGGWRRKCANNPGLDHQRLNLIARMRGEIISERRDWTEEEEIDVFVQTVTMLYPMYGAALLAKYAFPARGEKYHDRQASRVAYFNMLLTENGYTKKGRTESYFRRMVAEGRAAVAGYLKKDLDDVAQKMDNRAS